MLRRFHWFERILLSEKTALNKMNKIKEKNLYIHEG